MEARHKNPPHHVKVTAAKDKEGIVRVNLFGVKVAEPTETKKKKEEKKETKKPLEQKTEEVKATAEEKKESKPTKVKKEAVSE